MVARNRAQHQGDFLYEDREWFAARYAAGLSLRRIAAEAKCGVRTAARWAVIHGIATRTGSEAQATRPVRASTPRLCIDCGGPRRTWARSAKRCAKCDHRQRRGAGNSNWKGLADVMVLVRQGIASSAWRATVYKRDGYTCVDCGDATGGNLHAHHVVPLSVIVGARLSEWRPALASADDRLTVVRRLLAEPAILDSDNGVTLCEPCHRDRHRGPGTYAYAPARGGQRVVSGHQ